MAERPLRLVPLTFIVVVAVAVATAGSITATGSITRPASPPTQARCAVTVPTRKVSPGGGFGPAGFNYGSARLRVQLNWSHGTLRAGILPDGGSIATINRDGSVSAKVGWGVRDTGKLVITGRRLDRAAPPLRARIPPGYGPAYDIGSSLGFQPTGLTFPTVGCWRVIGQAGTARLIFVVRVTKLNPTVP